MAIGIPLRKINKNSLEFIDLVKENFMKILNNKESGFFDLPVKEKCTHPGHNPPSHLYIPPGKGYRHVCPGCKKETILIPPQISL